MKLYNESIYISLKRLRCLLRNHHVNYNLLPKFQEDTLIKLQQRLVLSFTQTEKYIKNNFKKIVSI